GNESYAFALNNSGEVVGNSKANSGAINGFLYSNGAMTDLGTASSAIAINNLGQVAGQTGLGGAFLYSNGTFTDLGTLGGGDSRPFAVNDSGQVVGSSTLSPGVVHAFLYSNGVMIDLNALIDPSLNVTLSAAYAINNAGQILAEAGPIGPGAF